MDLVKVHTNSIICSVENSEDETLKKKHGTIVTSNAYTVKVCANSVIKNIEKSDKERCQEFIQNQKHEKITCTNEAQVIPSPGELAAK